MSVRKWAYEPWKCEGDYCPGACDFCRKAEIEADGDLTWSMETTRRQLEIDRALEADHENIRSGSDI